MCREGEEMNQSSLDREVGGQQAVEVHSAMSSARRASSAISSASSSCIMHLGHWPALATSSIVSNDATICAEYLPS